MCGQDPGHSILPREGGQTPPSIVGSKRRCQTPFSKGLHYVLFVGLDKRGDVIVANSSLRANPKTAGVQVVPLSAVAEAMRPEGCLLRADLRWGLRGHYPTGYIVVK